MQDCTASDDVLLRVGFASEECLKTSESLLPLHNAIAGGVSLCESFIVVILPGVLRILDAGHNN